MKEKIIEKMLRSAVKDQICFVCQHFKYDKNNYYGFCSAFKISNPMNISPITKSRTYCKGKNFIPLIKAIK